MQCKFGISDLPTFWTTHFHLRVKRNPRKFVDHRRRSSPVSRDVTRPSRFKWRVCLGWCYEQQLPPCRHVSEISFYRLVQFCTIALYHCDETEDHCVARALLNLSFAFCNDSRPSAYAASPRKSRHVKMYYVIRWRNVNLKGTCQCQCKKAPLAVASPMSQLNQSAL